MLTRRQFIAPSDEEVAQRLRSKRDKLRKSKKKVDKTQLAKMRVLQRNLVYVTNLPPEFAKEDLLARPEYFGQYGKLRKIAVNANRAAASGAMSAYVTFAREGSLDAYHAILAADGAQLGGRTIKAAFGTTKYCSLFLRDQECTNKACSYLHEVGPAEDSFTKEDMAAGKHLLRELPAGSAPATVMDLGKDFRGVLPPPGTNTRAQSAAQRRGQKSGDGKVDKADKAQSGRGARQSAQPQRQQNHNQLQPQPQQHQQPPHQNSKHRDEPMDVDYTSWVVPVQHHAPEYAWSGNNPSGRETVMVTLFPALLSPPVASPPTAAELAADAAVLGRAGLDRELFVTQARALQRAVPHVNWTHAVSQGADGPPVPIPAQYLPLASADARRLPFGVKFP